MPPVLIDFSRYDVPHVCDSSTAVSDSSTYWTSGYLMNGFHSVIELCIGFNVGVKN